MTDNLKTAFDAIRAEDGLKANTVLYLQGEIRKRGGARVRSKVRGFAAAAAAAVILLAGVFSARLYFTPGAYVDMDVNPSVELTLNRFDRVIRTYAHNEDGADILTGLSLNHKNYEEAVRILIEEINRQGYIQSDGLVSVTVQANDADKTDALLAALQAGVTDYVAGHHSTAQVDVFPVSEDTQSQAREQNLSPAKYLAIQELIEADPTATVDSCRGHSISEIRRQIQAHGNHHGEESENGGGEGNETDEPGLETAEPGKGHHGENGGNGGGEGNGQENTGTGGNHHGQHGRH